MFPSFPDSHPGNLSGRGSGSGNARRRRRFDVAVASILTVLCSAGTPAQAPPPAGFPGADVPEGPPVLVRQFAADATELAQGDSTMLRWEVSNAYSLSIEPDIGTVATRGSAELAPPATTTYTLTAAGSNGVTTRDVTVTVAGTRPRTRTESASEAMRVPRLANGKPDLTGVYIAEGGLRSLVSRDAANAIRLAPGGESFRAAPRGIGSGEDCTLPGVPRIVSMPFPLQIVHRPDIMVIAYEAYQQTRIIPLDVPHEDYLLPAWNGHSVAHWDGDTLVVEVRGFNDKSTVAGFHHTENMTVVERYTRSTWDAIDYEARVEDPAVFAEPVRFTGTLRLHPEWRIQEYNCYENDQDYDALFEQ